MVKKYLPKNVSGDITPEDVFFSRRKFMGKALGLTIAGGASLTCNSEVEPVPAPREETKEHAALQVPLERNDVFPAQRNKAYQLPEKVRGHITPRLLAATHNNFYEFLPGRGGEVYRYTKNFVVDPWTVEIMGACNKPKVLDLDALFAIPHEERLYHFRCVERWAMNVPWTGFPLSVLLKMVDPTSEAKYVRFTTAKNKDQMPGIRKTPYYDWPYVEALRLDEAFNELAMVVTGVYGKPLPIQHGAPIRIIVPWKYGFKSPKSVVKIELLKSQPKTFWMTQPHEYGFLSNVNPNIPHPRWSQERSYWLGKNREYFPTEIFNGYGSYVAALYPNEPTTPQKALQKGELAR